MHILPHLVPYFDPFRRFSGKNLLFSNGFFVPLGILHFVRCWARIQWVNEYVSSDLGFLATMINMEIDKAKQGNDDPEVLVRD